RASRRFGCGVPGLFGIAVAVVWALHPLATSTVCYIYQRSEILTTFFYLASVLAVLVAADRRSGKWLALAWTSAMLSALSKEIGLTLLATIPLVERTAVFPGFKAQWRARRGFYGALLTGMLVVTGWISTGVRMTELGLDVSPLGTPWGYLKSQFSIL